jgi:hypothetical protein
MQCSKYPLSKKNKTKKEEKKNQVGIVGVDFCNHAKMCNCVF